MNTDVVSPPTAWSRLSAAIAYGLDAHAGQRRKGTDIPYVSHLLAVASLVLEAGGDEELAMAGMLHDAIEDVGAAQEAMIEARFGSRVARIVRACTDADTLPKPPWLERKQQYLAHLETADADVLLVSCADKLHNARAIVTGLRSHGSAMFRRFNAGQAGTLWYYGALAAVFEARLPGVLSRELRLSVNEMADLSRL